MKILKEKTKKFLSTLKRFKKETLLTVLIASLIVSQLASSYALVKVWLRLTAVENILNPPVKSPPKVTTSDHIRGNTKAKIAIIEYSDFDCPFCTRFHPTAKQALSEYDGKIMWVYRHFPLDSLHPNARVKAEASECVFGQGGDQKFWEFTDKLFELNPVPQDLPSLVTELGLDANTYTECIDAGKYSDKVTDQQNAGAEAGVTGTPGNYLVNLKTGKVVGLKGAVPYEQLKQAIDAMLK